MLILRAISLHTSRDAWMRDIQQFSDRWDKLQSFRCNPLNEMELMWSSLAGAAVPPPSVQQVVEFDPGRVTVTRRLGGNDDRMRYAFNLIRMLDDLAFPVTLGLSSNMRDALVESAKVIAPYAHLWSLSVPASYSENGRNQRMVQPSTGSRSSASECDATIRVVLQATVAVNRTRRKYYPTSYD